MKLCSECGHENEDGFSFCVECGRRIDGKEECPNCGNLNPQGVKYCGYCGNRIDGKEECPSCHKEIDKNLLFCPTCGFEVKKQKKDNNGYKKDNKGIKNESLYNLISKIVYIVLASICCIAVLCPILEVSSDLLNTSETLSIYDFLSPEYFNEFKTIDATRLEMVAPGLIINHLLSGIIAYVGFILTLVFGILAIVKNAISIAKKEQKPNSKFYIIALCSYLVLVFGLCFLMSGLYNISIGSGIVGNLKSQLGAMPIIVFVFAGLGVIALNVLKAIFVKFSVKATNIVAISLSCIASILVFVAIFQINMDLFKIEAEGLSMTSSMALSMFATYSENELIDVGFNNMLITHLVGMITCGVLVLCLVNILSKIQKKQNLFDIILPACSLGLSILYLIMSLLTKQAFNDKKGETIDISVSVGIIVVLMILTLGLSITSYILKLKSEEK